MENEFIYIGPRRLGGAYNLRALHGNWQGYVHILHFGNIFLLTEITQKRKHHHKKSHM